MGDLLCSWEQWRSPAVATELLGDAVPVAQFVWGARGGGPRGTDSGGTVTHRAHGRDGGTVVELRTRLRAIGTRRRRLSVLLVGLFSSRYAAVGESHGLSVIAGVLEAAPRLVRTVRVLDMAGHGDERPDRIVEAIRSSSPDVVGIAMPYGTYTVLKGAYPAIRAAVDEVEARVVFSGALATYLTDDVLELDPAAVAVVGESEQPMLDLLTRWARGVEDLHDVPGVAFVHEGAAQATELKLANLATVPPPARHHVVDIARAGGRVYAEASRPCSSAPSTCSLHGLTGIDGEHSEHRRFPVQRLAADMARLHGLGVESVVFADKDFLGPDLPLLAGYVDDLAGVLGSGRAPSFEFSTTVHAVYRHDDDRPANVLRATLLEQLRALGLRKVFLGVVSGSDSQLHRYARGHVAEECAAAIYRLRAAGLRLEVGFVMFDPLCTIAEIAENVAFIRRTGITGDISSITNELRVQQGSRYLHILERRERETARFLYGREVDKDTLSHDCTYASDEVARLISGIRPAIQALQAITHAVKDVSRLGEGTPAAAELRTVLARWNDATLTAIEAGVSAADTGHDPQSAVAEGLVEAGWALTGDVIGAHRRLPPDLRDHSVMAGVLQRCREFLDDPPALIAAHSGSSRRRPQVPRVTPRWSTSPTPPGGSGPSAPSGACKLPGCRSAATSALATSTFLGAAPRISAPVPSSRIATPDICRSTIELGARGWPKTAVPADL